MGNLDDKLRRVCHVCLGLGYQMDARKRMGSGGKRIEKRTMLTQDSESGFARQSVCLLCALAVCHATAATSLSGESSWSDEAHCTTNPRPKLSWIRNTTMHLMCSRQLPEGRAANMTLAASMRAATTQTTVEETGNYTVAHYRAL